MNHLHIYRMQKQARNIEQEPSICIGGKNKQGILEQKPSIYIERGDKQGILE